MEYRRTVLVEILVYHYRADNASCGCGWAELGRSHPEHVADVYEQSVTAQATAARPPIVRATDPWTSHVAADRIEPSRGTRKAAVLAVLQAAGDWVDGSLLTLPNVGGSEGLRRLRELRDADGWPIERRPHPESATAWQYRLPRPQPVSNPVEEPLF